MKLPDSTRRDADPDYLRELIDAAGISQQEAARRLGIDPRTMRRYLSGSRAIPYAAQYCLEALAKK